MITGSNSFFVKRKKQIQFVLSLLLTVGFTLSLSSCSLTPAKKYEKAQVFLSKGQYEKALDLYSELGNYEDASKYVMYIKAIKLADNADYLPAISTFKTLKDFRDSYERMIYYSARYYEDTLNFESALKDYNMIPTFIDSAERAKQIPILQKETYDTALSLYEEYRFDEAKELFTALGKYADSSHKVYECELRLIDQEAYEDGCSLYESQHFEEAIEYFKFCKDYRDSIDMVATCEAAIKSREYNKAVTLFNEKKYEEASEIFSALGDFSDSSDQVVKCTEAICERDYTKAMELLKDKEFNRACDLLISVGDYKDAQALLASNDDLAKSAKTKEFRIIGNTVLLGHYKDYGSDDGNNELEWTVLDFDVNTNQALLITQYSIKRMHHKDSGQYSYSKYPTWEKSEIRKWLNGSFLSSSFRKEERDCIVEQIITTSEYDGGSGGSDTCDKVFVLSREEAAKYFGTNTSRKTYLANEYYSDMNYWHEVKFAEHFDWWLRDPGKYGWMASAISECGAIEDDRYASAGLGVRPVVCLDLTAYTALLD